MKRILIDFHPVSTLRHTPSIQKVPQISHGAVPEIGWESLITNLEAQNCDNNNVC